MKNKLVIYSFIGLLSVGAIVTGGMVRNTRSQSVPFGQSQTPQTMQSPDTNMTDNPHAGHSMAEMNHSGMSEQLEEHHTDTSPNQTSQAKLSVTQTIIPNKPVRLTINVSDNNAQSINQFDTFQEKLMHLIIVSDNLQNFDHIHPTYKEKGRFEVEATFPQAGNYTLFSDYKPSGQKEQVSVLKTQVEGNTSSLPSIDLSTTKTIANTKVNLLFSQPTLKAGQEVKLTFDLKQVANNQPIADLQPYLGERGHLVILKQSSPLTRGDYIHAHAIKDTSGGKVEFITSFPQPGKYKLWGQFNRNGKIVVADFWVNVL